MRDCEPQLRETLLDLLPPRKFLKLSRLDAKKPPLSFLAASPKMERAKRLELKAGNSEAHEPMAVANSENAMDTQLSTHAGNELAEIVYAWPLLSDEVRAAVLTLVRVAGKKR